MTGSESLLAVRQLESGYWHIRGRGPCNWAQPPLWPCPDPDLLESSFFGEAAESFRRVVRAENDRLLEADLPDVPPAVSLRNEPAEPEGEK